MLFLPSWLCAGAHSRTKNGIFPLSMFLFNKFHQKNIKIEEKIFWHFSPPSPPPQPPPYLGPGAENQKSQKTTRKYDREEYPCKISSHLVKPLLLGFPSVWKKFTSNYNPRMLVNQWLGETPHLDRHAGAVEAERPETRLASEPLEAHRELAFGKGESVAEMQLTVHVRVREASEELVILWARIEKNTE